MRTGEKTCPSCAETIKLEARLCRFCKHPFSDADIAAEKDEAAGKVAARKLHEAEQERELAEKRVPKAIDKALKEINYATSLTDLTGAPLYQSDIDPVAAVAKTTSERARGRAEQLGMTYQDSREFTTSSKAGPPDKWPRRLMHAVQSDIIETSQRRMLNYHLVGEIAERHAVSARYVISTAVRLGAPYLMAPRRRKDGSFTAKYELPSRQVPNSVRQARSSPDMQYGVLQGPANLIGGCATMWGWIILLFVVAALLALITGQIS